MYRHDDGNVVAQGHIVRLVIQLDRAAMETTLECDLQLQVAKLPLQWNPGLDQIPCTGGGDTTPARHRRARWLVPPATTVERMNVDVTPGMQGRPQLDDVIADAGQRRKQWSCIDSYSEFNGFKLSLIHISEPTRLG